jgi:hypothetical protein
MSQLHGSKAMLVLSSARESAGQVEHLEHPPGSQSELTG